MKFFTERSFLIIFLLLALTCSVEASHSANNNDSINLPKKVSLNDKIIGLSKVWSEIKYNFINIDQIDFDIDSLYFKTIPKIINTSNDIEYYDELQRFMAAFNDGHTELITRSYNWNDYFDYIPGGIVEINHKMYFSSYRKNSTMDSTLLGAEIIKIEDTPVKEYLNQFIFPSISSSTENYRWTEASVKLQQGLKGSFLNGVARKLDGKLVQFSIPRNGESTRTPQEEYIGPKRKKEYEGDINLIWNKKIAVLTINSFYPDQIIGKIDSLATIVNSKADGLIIDLRNNRGGSSVVAKHLQKYILGKDTLLTFGAQKRINDGYFRSQGNYREEYKAFFQGKAIETIQPQKFQVESTLHPFNCKIIILIGKYSFSACEDFLVNIYEAPNRPLLIGEQTGGSTGAPLMIPLPNNAMARVCTVRILYPYSKKPFINKGVQPDIEIHQDINNYLKNNDVVMERAINELFRNSIH